MNFLNILKMRKRIMSLLGFLLIGSLISGAELIGNLSCNTTDDYSKCSCNTPSNGKGSLRLPSMPGEQKLIKYLTIEVDSTSSSFEIESPKLFQQFPSLQHLEIIADTVIFTPEAISEWDAVRNELFNLKKLETLIIEGADFFFPQHSWQLPSSLKKLVVKHCNYAEFNLSCCPNLEYIDFSNNPLTKIPLFPKCLPRLHTLTFARNPLLNLTVNDIARFCAAKELNLVYYSMGSYHRRCECHRLLNWTKVVTNFHLEPKCNLAATTLEDCQEYNLDEAKKIRDVCLRECSI